MLLVEERGGGSGGSCLIDNNSSSGDSASGTAGTSYSGGICGGYTQAGTRTGGLHSKANDCLGFRMWINGYNPSTKTHELYGKMYCYGGGLLVVCCMETIGKGVVSSVGVTLDSRLTEGWDTVGQSCGRW